MRHYLVKVIHGYLTDKVQAFSMPQRKHVGATKPVEFLKPSIDKGFVHKHILPDGFQVTVTITGDNLWFCNFIEIQIFKGMPPLEATISAENVSAKQIQCSHSLEKNCDIEGNKEHLPVKVCSHFAAVINKSVPVSYFVSQIHSYDTLILFCHNRNVNQYHSGRAN